jgi:hypothetical protein
MRFGGEVSQRNRNLLLDVLAHNLDVVLQLGRDGNNRRAFSDGALDETENLKRSSNNFLKTS